MRELLAALVLPAAALAQTGDLPPTPAPSHVDWLVRAPERTAGAFRGSRDGELVLDNGLVRRTFRLAPNGATVGLDALHADRSWLRAVEPEARLVLDGVPIDVGGLVGQPNHAYLTPDWLDAMRADPAAMRLAAWRVGPTEAPFEWKRTRWVGEDRPWPPRGVRATFTYRLDRAAATALLERRAAGVDGRELLLDDRFATLDPAWREHASPAHPRSGFRNEGKTGEILTPANTAAFAERALPEGATAVEALVAPGTDRSASWGPGVALVFADRAIKLNLRPGKAEFGVFDGRAEHVVGHLDDGATYALRLTRVQGGVRCEAARDGEAFVDLLTVPVPDAAGPPRAVRVGKTDRAGGDSDFGEVGDPGRCRIERLRAWGGLRADAIAARDARAASLAAVEVDVVHELYDGVPVLAKWLVIRNAGARPVRVDRFESERLAVVEVQNLVEGDLGWELPEIDAVSDYAFGGMSHVDSSRVVHWEPDPAYATQVNYRRETPCLLVSRPPVGPGVDVAPGASFETYRLYLIVHDSTDRERRGLGVRRAFRTLAPWCAENPLMMHMRTADPAAVRGAIDQCAAVGFEMLILSFGSGFDIESEDGAYLDGLRALADYAHEKGIQIGGYSLLSSRRISDADDVVDRATGRPGGARFGDAPCIGSAWGARYFQKLYAFFERTGFDLLEHDGSYPGDTCASTTHPGHRGYDDSQWTQWRTITDFYRWCRGRGIYLNVPDFYFLAGSTKVGMGYRETNWSLPREQQLIHTRQNVYDGTFTKTPSMGWMFVPLTEYHGGGAAATIEPLDAHLDTYEAQLYATLGAGVQACWRGPRLYDTDRTRDAVTRAVDWFKAHRRILESDVVHVRRADGRDVDAILHVNPTLDEKAMLLVWNPLDVAVERRLRVSLRYAGIDEIARVAEADGAPVDVQVARDGSIELVANVPARGHAWFVIRDT